MKTNSRCLLIISLIVMVSCHVPQNQKYEILRPKTIENLNDVTKQNSTTNSAPSKFLSLKPKRISKPNRTITQNLGQNLGQNFVEAYKGLVMPEFKNLNRGFEVGDQIRITVFREDNLSNIFVIDQNGMINYPLLGDIKILGETPSSVSKLLTQSLKGDYLVNPNVSVDRVLYCIIPQGLSERSMHLKAG